MVKKKSTGAPPADTAKADAGGDNYAPAAAPDVRDYSHALGHTLGDASRDILNDAMERADESKQAQMANPADGPHGDKNNPEAPSDVPAAAPADSPANDGSKEDTRQAGAFDDAKVAEEWRAEHPVPPPGGPMTEDYADAAVDAADVPEEYRTIPPREMPEDLPEPEPAAQAAKEAELAAKPPEAVVSDFDGPMKNPANAADNQRKGTPEDAPWSSPPPSPFNPPADAYRPVEANAHDNQPKASPSPVTAGEIVNRAIDLPMKERGPVMVPKRPGIERADDPGLPEHIVSALKKPGMEDLAQPGVPEEAYYRLKKPGAEVSEVGGDDQEYPDAVEDTFAQLVDRPEEDAKRAQRAKVKAGKAVAKAMEEDEKEEAEQEEEFEAADKKAVEEGFNPEEAKETTPKDSVPDDLLWNKGGPDKAADKPAEPAATDMPKFD